REAIYGAALKYLVWRGVLDLPHRVYSDVLASGGIDAICSQYDSILVTSDRTVFNLEDEYDLPLIIRRKLSYVGYLGSHISLSLRAQIRAERGIPGTGTWVVCSVGAGVNGSKLISACQKLAVLES